MRPHRTFVIKNLSIGRSVTSKTVNACSNDLDLRAEYVKGEGRSNFVKENSTASPPCTHEITSPSQELTNTDDSCENLDYGSDPRTSPESIPITNTSEEYDDGKYNRDGLDDHRDESYCCSEAKFTSKSTSALIFHCYTCKFTFCSHHWEQKKAHKRNELGHNKMVAAVARMFNDPVNKQLDEKLQALLHLFDGSSTSSKVQHHELVQMSEYLLYCIQCMREKVCEALTHCEEGPPFPPLDVLKRKQQQHVVMIRQRGDSAKRNTNRLLRLLQERLTEVSQRIVIYRDAHDRTQLKENQMHESVSCAFSRANQAAAKVKESESFLEVCQTRAQDTRMVLGLEIRRFYYLPPVRQAEIQNLLAQCDTEIKCARRHVEDCRRVSREDHETSQELKQEAQQLSQAVYELEEDHLRFVRQTQNEADHVFNWFQSLYRELNQLKFEKQSLQKELTTPSSTKVATF